MIKISDQITEELKAKANLTLLINQGYSLFIKRNKYNLIATREASLESINFEEKKTTDIIALFTDKGEFSLSFSFFSDEEIKLLKTVKLSPFKITIKLWEKNKNEEENSKNIHKRIHSWRSNNLFY